MRRYMKINAFPPCIAEFEAALPKLLMSQVTDGDDPLLPS